MSSTPLTIYVKVEPSFLFLGEVIAGGASPLAAAAAAFWAARLAASCWKEDD